MPMCRLVGFIDFPFAFLGFVAACLKHNVKMNGILLDW